MVSRPKLMEHIYYCVAERNIDQLIKKRFTVVFHSLYTQFINEDEFKISHIVDEYKIKIIKDKKKIEKILKWRKLLFNF